VLNQSLQTFLCFCLQHSFFVLHAWIPQLSFSLCYTVPCSYYFSRLFCCHSFNIHPSSLIPCTPLHFLVMILHFPFLILPLSFPFLEFFFHVSSPIHGLLCCLVFPITFFTASLYDPTALPYHVLPLGLLCHLKLQTCFSLQHCYCWTLHFAVYVRQTSACLFLNLRQLDKIVVAIYASCPVLMFSYGHSQDLVQRLPIWWPPRQFVYIFVWKQCSGLD